jgi:hypothetical protein
MYSRSGYDRSTVVKRVIISLLLLAAVFLMSGLFTPETNYSVKPALPDGYTSSPDGAENSQPLAGNFLHPGDYDPDTSGYPNLALVLLAALSSSLAMAIFIYGSHFIATWVAG